MPKREKPGKGNGGSDGGDGGDGGGGIIMGNVGDDRLRGSDGNDIFNGLGGNDTIKAGGGTDTLLIDGSIWDYRWIERSYSRGTYWELEDYNLEDGNTGIDTLYGVEVLQFNDATITMGEEFIPLVTGIPDELVVTVGEDASFDFSVLDLDDREISFTLSENWITLEYGGIRIAPGDSDQDRYGQYSAERHLRMEYTGEKDSYDADARALAEGERWVKQVMVTISTRNIWLDEFREDETYEYTFDLVIVGVNDPPEVIDAALFDLVENDPDLSLDLSALGSDYDSDDDGRTLSYSIVAASSGAFEVAMNDNRLEVVDPSIPARMTSDEVYTVTVEVAATDRHGAQSATTTEVTVELRGVDDTPPPPDYLDGAGRADLSGLDFAPADLFDFGESRLAGNSAFSGGTQDVAAIVDLLTFGDGDDARLIRAGQLITFQEDDRLRDADGNIVLDGLAFDTGAGHDTLVFETGHPTQAVISFVDMFTGLGEDLVAIDLQSEGSTQLHNTTIRTGDQSDRVLIEAEFGTTHWLTGALDTGSGHDLVNIRLDHTGADQDGGLLMSYGVSLGSGNDRFTLIADSANADRVFQHNDLSLHTGTGDDHVVIDLGGLGTLPDLGDSDPNGLLADAYPGGLEGVIGMGQGNNLVELTLTGAMSEVELVIYGDYAYLGADTGSDTLILHHLDPGAATVESFTDVFYGDGLRITDGMQTITAYGLDHLIWSDGSDWFAAS